MTNEQRVVLDTNVIVSAVLFPLSPPGRVFDYAFQHSVVLHCEATLNELATVLERPRFNRYVTTLRREEFLAAYIRDAVPIQVTETVRVCRDPRDDKFLELAVSGLATHLVTGDQDLLVLHPFRGVAIVTPGEFLDLVA